HELPGWAEPASVEGPGRLAMRHSARSCVETVLLLLTAAPALFSEEPQAILARAIQAQGGEAILSRARAVQAKIKGILYDPGAKESLIDGAHFTGELITQLPNQVKQSLHADTGAGRVMEMRVLNGHKSW